MNLYRIIGSATILVGVILNEWTIKYLSNGETKFNTIEKSLLLISIEIILILIGLYVFFKQKKAFQNLLLFFISFLTIFFILELTLKIPSFQQLSSSSPLWIPYEFKVIDKEIFQAHKDSSKYNIYGFNDKNYTFSKSDSLYRVAILGDSFVFGDGVVDSNRWTKKLQSVFDSCSLKVEVMSWGISGWSTKDEFDFLKKEGFKYDFDYLIFAYVINDPILDSNYYKSLIYPEGFIDRNVIALASKVFPNSTSLITGLLENFLITYFDYGSIYWYDNVLYAESNLALYNQLLLQIKEFCESNQIKFSFVLTPENHNPLINNYFQKIIKLLKENEIRYLNVYPYVKSELGNYSIRELWANPANGHPGELVNQVTAKYVSKYLIKELGL